MPRPTQWAYYLGLVFEFHYALKAHPILSKLIRDPVANHCPDLGSLQQIIKNLNVICCVFLLAEFPNGLKMSKDLWIPLVVI